MHEHLPINPTFNACRARLVGFPSSRCHHLVPKPTLEDSLVSLYQRMQDMRHTELKNEHNWILVNPFHAEPSSDLIRVLNAVESGLCGHVVEVTVPRAQER